MFIPDGFYNIGAETGIDFCKTQVIVERFWRIGH